MKHSLIIVLAALISASADSGAESGKHLFILSGQSNMAALDPNISFTPTVESAFGKENVIVVKDAQGGEPIRRWHKEWKPADGAAVVDRDGKPHVSGELYDRLMAKVNAAIQDEVIQTVTFAWMQGERDAVEKHGEVYRVSFEGLLGQLGEDLGRSDINFVIGRLSDFDLENKRYQPARRLDKHRRSQRSGDREWAGDQTRSPLFGRGLPDSGSTLCRKVHRTDWERFQQSHRSRPEIAGRCTAISCACASRRLGYGPLQKTIFWFTFHALR